jgi:WD40 repeat protein
MASLGEKLKKGGANGKSTILPSGLASEEAATLAGNLATALRRANRTSRGLNADNITFNDDGSLTLPSGDTPTTPAEEQTAFAELLYNLTTGEKYAGSFVNLPQATATVLEKGYNGDYNSVSELAGAFGWSLYRLNLPQTVEKQQKYVSKRLQNIAPMVVPPVLRWGLPVAAVLGITALLIFIIFATITTPAKEPPEVARQTNANTPNGTPGATSTPSAPPYFVTTRNPDGAQLTRFNPAANLSAPQLTYTPPVSLPVGGITSLNGKHPLALQNAQWSPSRTLLYLSTTDGGWEVWDTQSKTRISRREMPDADNYLWMSYAPNGENFVALGFDGQLRLGKDGRVRKTVPYIIENEIPGWQTENWADYFHWSPNSNRLAIERLDRLVNIWDFESEINRILPTINARIPEIVTHNSAFKWAKNSRNFAIYAAPINEIIVYDGFSLQRLYSIDLDSLRADGAIPIFDESPAQKIDFDLSADGRYLAIFRRLRSTTSPAANDGALAIFELPANEYKLGEIVKPVEAQFIRIPQTERYGIVSSVEWSRDNKLALLLSGSAPANPSETNNATSRLTIYALQSAKWEALTGLPLENRSPTPVVYRQFWSPDGRQLLLSKPDGYLALYPLGDERLGEPNVLQESNTETMLGWAFSPDGKWLAYYDMWHNLVVQEAATRRSVFTETLRAGLIPDVSGHGSINWSPDSRFFRVHYSRSFIDRSTEPQVQAHIWQVKDGKFSHYGAIYLPNILQTNTDWNYLDTKPQLLFEIGGKNILSYGLTNPPVVVETQKERWVGSKIYTMTTPESGSYLVDPNPDFKALGLPVSIWTQKYFVGNGGTNVVGWSRSFERAVYFNGNPNVVKVSRRPTVNDDMGIIDVELSPTPEVERIHSNSLNFSLDGKLLAIGFPNGLVKVYDTGNGQLAGAWTAHMGTVTGVQFSPDGKLLATTSTDRTIKVWDVATGRNVYMLRAHLFPVHNLVWLADGRNIAAQSAGQILIWRVR